MTSWTDFHYERAEEFLRQLEGAIAAPAADVPAGAPAAPAAVTRAASIPTPLPPAPAVPPGPTPPPSGPTAASVFQKIPWKK